jgi:SAM-dependent methyltransferase
MPHDHAQISPHHESILEQAQSLIASATPHPNYAVYRQQERLYWKFAPRWIVEAGLGPDSRVLDVGCAYGTLAVFTRLATGASVDAVDFIDAYTPRDLFKRLELRFTVNNVETDPPAFEGPYDFIIFTEVFEHLNFSPVPTLHKLAGMLKPGGSLLLTTPDAKEWGRVLEFYPGLRAMPAPVQRQGYFDGHVWQYRVHELLWALREGGFTPVELEHSPGVTARHFNTLLKRIADIEPGL